MCCRIFGFAFLVGLFVSSTAHAQFGGYQPYQSPQSGTSFYSGPDGMTSVTRSGNFEFYNFPNGKSATATHLGNQTFVNGPSGQSSITNLGSTSFYNGPGNLSGSSQQFGNQRLYQFSNGASGAVRNWGGFSTYDFSGPGNRYTSGAIMPIGGVSRPYGWNR